MRYLWSVPAAVVAWFVAGFGGTYLRALPDDAGVLVPGAGSRVDLLVLGGLAGGVFAGLLVARLRVAVPLVLVVAAGTWWFSGHTLSARNLLITLLVASAVGALLGALGTRSSVVAALALAVPLAWYASRPESLLSDWKWLWQLNGALVTVGLAILLYVACWRRGWRSVSAWIPVTAMYLAGFGVVAAIREVAGNVGRTTDEVANLATERFFGAFEPLLREYWPWLVLAVLLAIPMVALKIRALPPAPPPVEPDDLRGNDARLSDDLDWVDREEPRRRLLKNRADSVGAGQ